MTIREAITILTEYNKWRRGLPPYDGDNPDNYRGCPYRPKEIGEAIDTLVDWVNSLLDGKAMIVDKGWLEQHDAIRLDKAIEWIMRTPMYCKQPTTLVEEFREFMDES